MTRNTETLTANIRREFKRALAGMTKGCDGLTHAECKDVADKLADALAVLNAADYRRTLGA